MKETAQAAGPAGGHGGAVTAVSRTLLRPDVSDVAPPGCRTTAMEVVAPAAGSPADARVLFCFPGGGISRRYFDLEAPGYSFAEYACARGFIVVLADHPGVGDSDRPDDAWTLTPETVARVNATATARALAALEAGEVAGLPPLRPAAVVGVGHSAGGHLLIHHQAVSPRFDGIAVLGWRGRGLPEYLDEDERTLAGLPAEAFAAALVAGARRRFTVPLPESGSGTSELLVRVPLPADVRQALARTRTGLLAVVGYSTLIPGSAWEASAAVTVPVFAGVGEHDIVADHHAIPAEFPHSGDITLFVLAGSGHNQNVAPSRERLWDRLLGWAGDILPSEHQSQQSPSS